MKAMKNSDQKWDPMTIFVIVAVVIVLLMLVVEALGPLGHLQ